MNDLFRGFEHLVKPSTIDPLELVFPPASEEKETTVEETEETSDEDIKSIVCDDVFGGNEQLRLPMMLEMVREWETKVNDYVSKHADKFRQLDDRREFMCKCFATFWKMVSDKVTLVHNSASVCVFEDDDEKQ